MSTVYWIARPAEPRLQQLFDAGVSLIVVHGLGGAGASALVARCFAARRLTVRRVDLSACGTADGVLRNLQGVNGDILWLDQVHDVRPVRAALLRWPQRGDVRLVIAARAPLRLPDEACVPLSLLDRTESRELLQHELGSLGVRDAAPTDALVSMADGWPLAVREIAQAVRALGFTVVLSRGLLKLPGAASCAAVLREGFRALAPRTRELLVAMSASRGLLDTAAIARHHREAVAGLRELVDAGWVHRHGEGVRVVEPIAHYARAMAPPAQRRRAEQWHVALTLQQGERARRRFRASPKASLQTLMRIEPDLFALSGGHDVEVAARAIRCLEPLMLAHLPRERLRALSARVESLAAHTMPRTRANLALGQIRALLARGEHESAESLLMRTRELGRTPWLRAYRQLYLAHIEAWRGCFRKAELLLQGAARHIMLAGKLLRGQRRVAYAEEDLWLQRVFLAHKRADFDTTERLCRRFAAETSRRPSPRMVALVRRFSAEVLLHRGAAKQAAELFRRSRDELTACGDVSGALLLWSRFIAALRAAGEVGRADLESQAAAIESARTHAGAVELILLDSLSETHVSRERVAELAWQAQIPALKRDAEQWMDRQAPVPPPKLLRLYADRTAVFDGRVGTFARRDNLWRVLLALARHAESGRLVTSDDLFMKGWPDERVPLVSRKKRVQTAVWALRRLLLGDELETQADGYALARSVRVVQTPP